MPPAAASAQTAAQDSVLGRARPDFAPVGMELDRLLSTTGAVSRQAVRDRSSRLASMLVFPKLEITTAYETNLFRDDTREHDRIVVVSPELAVKSDWARHNLEFSVDADIGRHVRNDPEDFEDVRGTIAGRVDVAERVEVTARAQLAQLHQRRGSVLFTGRTGGAVTFVQSGFLLGGEYKGDAFRGLAELSTTGSTYDSDGGVDNSDLDRVITTFRVRGAYEFLPGTAAFVQPSLNDRRYDRERDFNGRLQDSDGWEMLTGLSWDLSGVTYAELGVGYLRQNYDEPAFSTIAGPSFSGKLIWNPDDLWTLTGEAQRTVEETKQAGFAGVLATRFAARIDFELREDTILSLRGAYTIEDYKGAERTDDRYSVEFEARQFVNEYFFLRAVAGYDKRAAEQVGASFSNVRGALSLGAQI